MFSDKGILHSGREASSSSDDRGNSRPSNGSQDT